MPDKCCAYRANEQGCCLLARKTYRFNLSENEFHDRVRENLL